jgi:hypothetical protein
MPTFIEDYLFATSGNESPVVYHKWSCLSALSALVGRRFWFNHGPFTYYPNFYTLLVGDAGVKKSSAMDRAKDLIRAVGSIPIAATSTSKEAITKMMGDEKYEGRKKFTNSSLHLEEEYTQLAIFATEFTSFLGMIAPESILDFLTGIYTEKVYDEKFKGTGNQFFPGPYVTLLGCLVPHTMKGVLKQAVVQGGFSRRTMFVYGFSAPPVAWPEYTPAQQAAFARCVSWGKEIAKHHGEMRFSETDKERFKAWYDANYNSVSDKKPVLQPYFRTKHEFLLKTLMLMTLSIDGPSARMMDFATLEYLDRNFFAPVEEHLERVFDGTGTNPEAEAAAQVCRMLESLNKPMPRKKIEALFFASSREITKTVDHLVMVGRLSQKTASVNGVMQNYIGTPACMENWKGEALP